MTETFSRAIQPERAQIVDLFAGIGWAEGMALLGLHEVGLERDEAACATRSAAGHQTIRCDVANYPKDRFVGVEGLIASPPCPDWSTAGSMKRREGDTGWLVDAVPEWVLAVRPRWVICEQVPQAEIVWRQHAEIYEEHGYRTSVGVVDAVNFGVPQNRLRAILLASIDAHPFFPAPTHTEGSTVGLFDELAPAVTLADVLGLEPGWVYDSGQNSRAAGGGTVRYVRSCDRPAGTLTTKTTTQWVFHGPAGERRKMTRADAARIQTFRAGLPWHGTSEEQDRQIGNAVPPLLAAHLVSAVTGIALNQEVADVA